MKKEELLEIGLTEEQADKVFAMNGRAVEAQKALTLAESAKVEAANETIRQLRETVGRFDGVDLEKLRGELKTLQEKYDADMAGMRRERAIDAALLSGGARNARAVRALLDDGRIHLKGDELTGLDEQIKALKASDPYLFAEASKTGMSHQGGTEGTPDKKEEANAALRAVFAGN